jgi:hypothetical protein
LGPELDRLLAAAIVLIAATAGVWEMAVGAKWIVDLCNEPRRDGLRCS